MAGADRRTGLEDSPALGTEAERSELAGRADSQAQATGTADGEGMADRAPSQADLQASAVAGDGHKGLARPGSSLSRWGLERNWE